ncbi:hypothetical protein CC78DRAFT_542272 [Lojkania enalia]|uniref:Protein kinase domain-containing protein n=1 Tax=Lojkania enalia TaxID=147567 RepID=A0A9P4KCC0_9PLEO|nr:hypothetical protein CC78DRAFT_542272 [Didymosphaeria enalia]
MAPQNPATKGKDHQTIFKSIQTTFNGWFHDKKGIFLVLENACRGNRFNLLERRGHGRFSEDAAARKNIMHRGLKPDNILQGLRDEVKVVDFGYSVYSVLGFMSTICGTLDYLSPEAAIMMRNRGKSVEFSTNGVD